jgi:hypothetical protein
VIGYRIDCNTKGRWRNTIVLNVHAPAEDKSDDTKIQLLRETRECIQTIP